MNPGPQKQNKTNQIAYNVMFMTSVIIVGESYQMVL